MPNHEMPEGAIALLFTDMQDSTKLSANLPPLEWQRIAAEHDRRVVACIEEHGGKPERSDGDSFFATFPNSRDALRCAIAIQQAFPAEGERALRFGTESGAPPVQVRVGVSTPDRDVFRTETGVFRDHKVSLAARLMACAYGGQILASESACRAGRDYLQHEWQLWEYRYVRDFPGPVTLCELLWESGGKSRGMKAPLWAPEWLLREVNKFIGRDEYLTDIIAWLQGDRPLLLLHGQGGIGKTRLASQAVRQPEVGSHFEGRIYGVALDLKVGTDPAKATVRQLAGLIAEAVGEPEQQLAELADETVTRNDTAVCNLLIACLNQRFPRQEFLLVLDNFESVCNDANLKLMSRLLREVRVLRCLTTCRVHFNLGAVSQALPVDGLHVPTHADDDFVQYDGYLLFHERAVQNAPDIDLADKVSVAHILQATEGSALGIELIAARLDTPFLTLSQIADDLTRSRLTVQDADPGSYNYRVDVERHSSLEACFDWSLRLLPEEERTLYPRLSVFPTDFAPEAAQEIAEIPIACLRRWALWNLLKQTETKTRAFLPPALHEFAQRRLPAQVSNALVHQFITYYSDLAAQNTNMNSPAQRTIVNAELGNFHVAAETLCAAQPKTMQEAAWLFSLGLALGNSPLGIRFANLRREIACYEAALRVRTEADFPQDWATTQNNLAIAYRNLPTGDRGANLARAIACYEAALRVYTEADFPQDWAMTQNNLGNAYGDLPTGDRGANLARAIACYEAALRVYTEADFPQQWANTQFNLALALADRGDQEEARKAMQNAVIGYRHVGMEQGAREAEDWLQQSKG